MFSLCLSYLGLPVIHIAEYITRCFSQLVLHVSQCTVENRQSVVVPPDLFCVLEAKGTKEHKEPHQLAKTADQLFPMSRMNIQLHRRESFAHLSLFFPQNIIKVRHIIKTIKTK